MNKITKIAVELLTNMFSSIKSDRVYRTIKDIMPDWYNNRYVRKLQSVSDLKRFYKFKENYMIENYKRILILELESSIGYFNVAFLNHVLSFCLFAVTNGYIPRIKILDLNGANIWERYFEQPFNSINEKECEVNFFRKPCIFLWPEWSYLYNKNYINLFVYLYKKFCNLNFQTTAYINQEKREILSHGRMLGVLCRGTDYLKAPKGHPIQPSENEIVSTVRKVMNNGYDSIYLATEDSRYVKLLENEFKGGVIFTNKRNYYDKKYYSENANWICNVHFERENDDYLKGLEYLSSLKILSECDGFVGGNCGGTQAAIFFNGGKYKDCIVFDHGLN